MKTEEEIKEKAKFLEEEMKKNDKKFIDGEIEQEFYLSKSNAIKYFAAALEWVLEE